MYLGFNIYICFDSMLRIFSEYIFGRNLVVIF